MIMLSLLSITTVVIVLHAALVVEASQLLSQIEDAEYLSLFNEASAAFARDSNAFDVTAAYAAAVARDLAPFNHSGVTRHDVVVLRSLDPHFVTYRVVCHNSIRRVYRSIELSRCLFPARCAGVERFLVDSDGACGVEFVVNFRDSPAIDRRSGRSLPLFSFSKRPATHVDIMYPAWAFWSGGPVTAAHPRGIGRWDLMRELLSASANRHPWSKKARIAFFRGSRTNDGRDILVLASRRHPAAVDAKFTRNQAWRSAADTLGDENEGDEVGLEQHCRYRYLLNAAGVAASFRFRHLFLCGSLIIHATASVSDGDFAEFFYEPLLRPWVHYVPFALPSDGSGTANNATVVAATADRLVRLLSFLSEHEDDVARVIARRGTAAVRRHLRLADVANYWQLLLTQYAKLMRYRVDVNETESEFVLIA